MNQKFKMIIGASAASAMVCTGLAQQSSSPPTDENAYVTQSPPPACAMDLGGAIKASKVIGTTVKNSQDEKLGKVSDLLLDVESGRVVQVILASGGFLGINPNLTAVPPDALSHEAGQKYFLLDESREKLQAAPKFDAASWNEGAESNAVTEAQVQAGKLMGATVWNLQGEKLGNVKDFIVDLPADRIMAVIISSGGFIGIDGELSAIPPNALRFTGGHDALQLDVSKEALANAPHFKTSEWPDFSRPEYVIEVDRAYNVKPYFVSRTETAANNSGRNIRDRDSGTLTPLDQGGSHTDVSITTQIRKAILASAGMSVNAQNVKIITINGRVTLRGPVNTTEEKQTIGEIADRIAQPGNVDNQLEVELATRN